MPTKTKKNPNVDLANKVRNILLKSENRDDFKELMDKNGIVHAWVDCAFSIEAVREVLKFANSNPESIVFHLLSDRDYKEEEKLALNGDGGDFDAAHLCAVPLEIAKKIVKKGSL